MSAPYQYKCVSCHEMFLGGKYDVICEDCRSGHSAVLLDAFYGAVPEHFATEDRTAGCAAGIPLNDTDRMWLRGIRKAIFTNHPLTRMTRLDEEMGLYDGEQVAPASGIAAATAVETAETGSTEGKSPTGEAGDAQ